MLNEYFVDAVKRMYEKWFKLHLAEPLSDQKKMD